jgi:hypothetical protein
VPGSNLVEVEALPLCEHRYTEVGRTRSRSGGRARCFDQGSPIFPAPYRGCVSVLRPHPTSRAMYRRPRAQPGHRPAVPPGIPGHADRGTPRGRPEDVRDALARPTSYLPRMRASASSAVSSAVGRVWT